MPVLLIREVYAINTELRRHFGFTAFRPGQQEAIESILQGQHTLVVMPTGAGKSLIYQFAALRVGGLTMVVSPLIALMEDQVSSLHLHKIPAIYINSKVPPRLQQARLREIVGGVYRLVYVAPERFRSRLFQEMLRHVDIGLLAIDEAHCISEWGHDFRPDYRRIAKARTLIGDPLTMALTATATPRVQDDIASSLGLVMNRIVTGFDRPNLTFKVIVRRSIEEKLGTIHGIMTSLFQKEVEGGVLIYTGTRNSAEVVAAFVRDVVGLEAQHYHAGLNHDERSAIQHSFLAGRLPVLAATNAFGMGVDRQDIRLAIHFQIPGSLEAYYQQAGRAGRDGRHAEAVLLYNPADRSLQDHFIESSVPSMAELRALYALLEDKQHGSNSVTIHDLSAQSGFHPTMVRVGLEQLELAGLIERDGDEGLTLHLRTYSWRDTPVQHCLHRLQINAEHGRQQLQEMIAYAEADGCRRRHILRHFGDNRSPSPSRCCDNCLKPVHQTAAPANSSARLKPLFSLKSAGAKVRKPVIPSVIDFAATKDKSQQEPLESQAKDLILACVRSLPGQLPRSGIAKVLVGSTSSRIQSYRNSPFYGRLRGNSRTEVTATVDKLIDEGLLLLVGKHVTLNESTPGNCTPASLADPHLEQRIVAWGEEGNTERLSDLIAALTDDRYNVRRLAASALGKLADARAAEPLLDLLAREEFPQIRQYAVKALGNIRDNRARGVLIQIADDKNEKYYTRDAARAALKKLERVPAERQFSPPETLATRSSHLDKSIAHFLDQSRPQRLDGPWDAGWALDCYSRTDGRDWERSRTGELLYQFKYGSNRAAGTTLSIQLAQFCKAHRELTAVDILVPMPSSVQRYFDPVLALARALSETLGIPTLSLMEKSRTTAPQKEMRTIAQKTSNIRGVFRLTASVKGRGILLIDDLYDSGSTLSEATRTLQQGGASRIQVLVVAKTIHTDS